MFTGIIETLGEVVSIEREGSNLSVRIRSRITSELKIDQSVAHNGICLTVVEISGDTYRVTAIEETISKTNIKYWKQGDKVNLERAMSGNARFDGHMVQGHVDQTAECVSVTDKDGSREIWFSFRSKPEYLLVKKGSVCVDGVSLTVVDVREDSFSVAIIPYTWEHTVFHAYLKGSVVNIEFDVVGKYVQAYMEAYRFSR